MECNLVQPLWGAWQYLLQLNTLEPISGQFQPWSDHVPTDTCLTTALEMAQCPSAVEMTKHILWCLHN